MPTDSYLPSKDADLAGWMNNFSTVAAANDIALHLTVADLATLNTNIGNFTDGNANVIAAKSAAEGAVAARKVSRAAAVADARSLVNRIQHLPGISDDLKRQLRITVSAGRRPEVPVFTPVNLVAAVQPDMTIRLRWDKGGNHYGTSYKIERKCGTDTAWTMVDKITATHFYDAGCTAGTVALYRITAVRGHLVSQPSPQVVVNWQ